MADRSPLPPESPDECDDTRDTTSASSAPSSKKSTGGDPQSTFRRPTAHGSATTPGPTIPGVEEYLTGTQKVVEATRTAASPEFARPKVTSAKSGKPVVPMTGKALEIASRMKELFHAYDNRQTGDNRSAQQTLGPSEIGSPCDRRIAMSLLRLPPVNPGGDGWAAFVGTCVHVGLAEMLVWGNAGSGRYQTEVPLTFNSEVVPRGTTDLIDTALLMVDDHKLMGSWSLNKLRTEGPSETYRVQAHTYGMGAKLKGFDIKDVAIIAWPRDKSSLDDLYVWTEPYDPQVARDAIQRVEEIAVVVKEVEVDPERGYASEFAIDNSDCRYCPYHLPGAAKSEGGVCTGRQ